jgi:beta-lactam-binding protein with PASTA domain
LPDVTGMRYDEAQKLLEQAGFFVEIAGLDIYNEPQYDNDLVLSMFPRRGSYHDDKDFEIMLYLYEHG